MNIVRALDVALPELPERIVRQIPPRLDSRVISREHIEKGESVVLVKMPRTDLVFRFSPSQWQLIRLFDGKRSFAEIAERFQQESRTAVSEEDVRELADFLLNNSQLLYRSPIEQNFALQQELRSQRKKRSRSIDLSDITLQTWDNADGYISWLYPRVRFLFTPWFVWTSIGMFALMGWMWADRFGEIWRDSFAFYNFAGKSSTDLIEFWFLFGAMAGIHETAHGLVGKHFGATIEKMGFGLLYFAPTFFCDATQVWVLGGRWARIAVSIAGIWLDLIVCFLATIIWWGTATGMAVHNWAYMIMMVTGIGVSVLNLNPLIKLDGYLIFSELVSEPALKESATLYLSTLVRRRIFGLPVEVPFVPRSKRTFFLVYGVLSGLYSYVLLSFLMVITYHILRSYNPEWAFFPALAIGIWVFRSRIRNLVNFMKILYLDKKERMRAWFTPRRLALITAAALAALLLPLWPDFVPAQFVLDASRKAVLRASVPGLVARVDVNEGQVVSAGSPLLEMRNLELQSRAAEAQSRLSAATARAVQASLTYTDFPAAESERLRSSEVRRIASDKFSRLAVTSPISGQVMTPHVTDLTGRSVDEGDLLLQVSDTSEMKANLYIPEYAIRDVRMGTSVRLLIPGRLKPASGTLTSISASSVPMAEGLLTREQLQGIAPPRYYLGAVFLRNDDGYLREDMAGPAKIFVTRRSLAGFTLRFCRDLVGRRLW